MLAVSEDGDWAAYAKNSRRIEVVPNFAQALQLLQAHAVLTKAKVQRFLCMLQGTEKPELIAEFQSRLETALSSHPIAGRGHSVFEYEFEQLDLSVRGYDLVGNEGNYEVTVVRTESREVAFEVDVIVNAKVSATFSFRDSVDRDYVSMGAGEFQRELDLPVTILMTIMGDLDSISVKIASVEIVAAPNAVDFGEIEPDYLRYQEYDEFVEVIDDNESPEDDIPF